MSLSRNRSMTMNSMSAAFFRRPIMRRRHNGDHSNPAARVQDCASLHPGYGAGLIPAEPVVAAVFPVAAEVLVEHVHADDVFGILESEFGRHPDLHRESVFHRQDVVVEPE